MAFTAELQNLETQNIENRQRKIYPNFQVLEQDDHGNLVTAKTCSEYYPIYFTSSELNAKSVIGLEIGISEAVKTVPKSA